MDEIYYIRIKKEYATAVIEDLQKMEAVELLREADMNIPEWQKDLVNLEKKKIRTIPRYLLIGRKPSKNLYVHSECHML